jgi:hypothetical protein
MGNKLLIVFAIGGGIPPATSILLRIYSDGDAIAVIGNTWPERGARNEAGLYHTKLPLPEIDALDTFISKHRITAMVDTLGARQPDSLFNLLHLFAGGRETKLKWGFYADVPPPLQELRTRMSKILLRVRRHPKQILKAELKATSHPGIKKTAIPVTFELRNIGTHAMQVLEPQQSPQGRLLLKIYAADDRPTTAEEDQLAGFFHRSQLIRVTDNDEMPATDSPKRFQSGEHHLVEGVVDLKIDQPGTYRLFGFVETDLDLLLDEQPLRLESLLMTQPIPMKIK